MIPDKVRCRPLGDEERVCEVVDHEYVADPNGIRARLTVDVDGHHFCVSEFDATPV